MYLQIGLVCCIGLRTKIFPNSIWRFDSESMSVLVCHCLGGINVGTSEEFQGKAEVKRMPRISNSDRVEREEQNNPIDLSVDKMNQFHFIIFITAFRERSFTFR